ncbi:probable polygalacturonase At3g15720 [Benincasa hispida]|uniref:probable polygalacturonase At3g15720 n=1 Tax=Benincasa hispida TaxID=102211 RepID=UPI0018FF4304|nr:probable polygalacturonase At3g15720 [Benincasa hispida]
MKLLFALIFIFTIDILTLSIVSASSNFNVLDYGAIGNGKADDSEAFLKAWNDVCGATEDSPTLHVPDGKTYLLNPLKFQGPCKSNQVNFDLRGTLMAPSKDEWPSDGADKWVQFYDIEGLNLKGAGKFDGQGSLWWKDCDRKHCKRPTALFFHNCNGLQVKEMKHINSGRNHISINDCNDVIFSNIQILAPEESPNTDGIDISKSKNVLIQDSFIATGDDCIAINEGSSDINIIGITCGPGHGISIGSLGKDGAYNVVENIHVSNCLLQGTQNGVRIKTWQGGYGYAKNITFEKITLKNAKNPIIIDQYYTSYAYSRKIKGMDIKVSDVTYREVNGTSANEDAITLNCSRARCTNIILDNVNIKMITLGKEAKAICQNVDGKFLSTVPIVSCLSKSH